jgi:histidinol dehydrogenase
MLKLPLQIDRGEESVAWLRREHVPQGLASARSDLHQLEERILSKGSAAILEDARERGLLGSELGWVLPGQRLPAALLELDPASRALIEERRLELQDFHLRTLPHTLSHESRAGDRCKLLHAPLRRVGIVLPRNGLPLSLLLSLAVPALVAGVEEIVVAMPRDERGRVHAGVLAACELLGVRQVLPLGGMHAVLALAHGGPGLEACDLIVGEDGPEASAAMGSYAARGRSLETDSIGDLVCLTDAWELDPAHFASELLWHAELGGPGLRAVLCSNEEFVDRLRMELEQGIAALPRGQKTRARQSLAANGRLLVVPSLARAATCANALRPQRLCVLVHNPKKLLPRLAGQRVLQLGPSQLPSALLHRQPWALPVLASASGPVTTSSFVRAKVTLRSGRSNGADAEREDALDTAASVNHASSTWRALERTPTRFGSKRAAGDQESAAGSGT